MPVRDSLGAYLESHTVAVPAGDSGFRRHQADTEICRPVRHRTVAQGQTGLHEDPEGDASAQVLPVAAQVNTGTIPDYLLQIDDVWTVVAGRTFSTTSGNPLRPSQTRKNTSRVPRFRMSVSRDIENLVPSPPVPAHNPSTSRRPSRLTSIAA
ncbi:hypothetical protein SZ00_06213 (plasmid) [Rhodococcus sp. AD45]|nr:hypothetical protein SZ00_06213 [Rhodococcus sp. AD45]